MRLSIRDILVLMLHLSLCFAWLKGGFHLHRTENFGYFYWLAVFTGGWLLLSGWLSHHDRRPHRGFFLTAAMICYVAVNSIYLLENAWLTQISLHYADPMALHMFLAVTSLCILVGIIASRCLLNSCQWDLVTLLFHAIVLPASAAINLYVWYLISTSV